MPKEMPKDEKKKNVVQDIVPPKRSIRDIEVPERIKREEEIRMEPPMINIVPPKVPLSNLSQPPQPPKPPKPLESPSYTYDYKGPRKSRIGMYVAGAILIIALIFGISSFFKSAEIRVSPKEDTKTVNTTFTAKKEASGTDLGFQVVTISKELDKQVDATGKQDVSIKARGKIVIYNNYNSESQKLVATTRFETPKGLIFRLINPAVVPGRQIKDGKTVAGSIEVTVEADKAGSAYNIGLEDFTIPGFKGDPRYTQMYARSKTPMTGGFVGSQKIVSKTDLGKTDVELQASLKEALSKDIALQIPANFILYGQGLLYDFDPATQVPDTSGGDVSSNSALVRKKGTVSAVMFDKSALSRSIIAKVSPDVTADVVKVTNLEQLEFNYASTAPDLSSASTLSFNLKGDSHLVWIFDENKLKSELLGLSKSSGKTLIGTYGGIKEAWIETRPFWNQNIPSSPDKVTFINTANIGNTNK